MKLGKSVRYVVRDLVESKTGSDLKTVANSILYKVWHSVGNRVWRSTEFPVKNSIRRELEDGWD